MLLTLLFYHSLISLINLQSWVFPYLKHWLLLIIFPSPLPSFLNFSIFTQLHLSPSHKTIRKHAGSWLDLHYTLLHMNRPSAIKKNLLDTKPTRLSQKRSNDHCLLFPLHAQLQLKALPLFFFRGQSTYPNE